MTRDTYTGNYGDPLSLNRYTYGHNNPIKYVDPTGHSVNGVNFGPNEGADCLRTGSGKTFEEFWGCGPYGTPLSSSPSGSTSNASSNKSVNFGPNEGADWLRTGSGKSFEEFWGCGSYESLQVSVGNNRPNSPAQNSNKSTASVIKTQTTTILQVNTLSNNLTIDVVINGNKIKNTAIINGNIFGDEREVAQALGIPYYPAEHKVSVNGQIIASTPTSKGYMLNVKELTKAKGLADCLSWWDDSEGTHILVNADLKNAPVKVIREGNSFTITAYIEFTGDYDQYIIQPRPSMRMPGVTYAEAVKDGIEMYWSSPNIGASTPYDFGGMAITVNTTVIVKDPQKKYGDQRFVKYDISTQAGTCNLSQGYYGNWTVKGAKTVKMYAAYPGNQNSSYEEYMRIAAHEFGHVLGICDAYAKGRRPAMIVSTEVPANDLMRTIGRNDALVTANDIEMMWQAYRENSWQYFVKWKGPAKSTAIRGLS